MSCAIPILLRLPTRWKAAVRSNASSPKARPTIRENRLDELQEFVKRYGAGALAWIKVGE